MQTTEATVTKSPSIIERYSMWLPVVAGMLVFLPTLWYGFVWDDRYGIVNNTSLPAWRNLGRYFWGPLNPTTDMYRPITSAVTFLEYHLFDLHAWGYHLTSTVLHAGVCLAVYYLALRLSGIKAVAVFSGLLFAVHAVHLEAIAWASALAEPLMAIATLAGFCFYLNYRKERRGIWLAATCASLFAGLLCKETAIVLPLLIVAFEWTSEGPKLPKIRQLLPTMLLLSITALVYLAMRHSAYPGTVYNESKQLPLATLLMTLPSLLLIYCRTLLVPTPLSPFYDSSYVTSLNSSLWLPLLGLIAIGTAIYFVSRRLACGNLVRFCAAAMAISIIPALDLNIFQFGEILHDRFLYLPSVFFAILLSLSVAERGNEDQATTFRPLAVTLVSGFLLFNVAALLIQSPVWKSDRTLFSYATTIAPGNSRPAFTMAMFYLEDGDLPNAEKQLEHVVRLVPAPKALFLLGQTRLLMGHTAAAEDPLRRAIAVAPDRPGQHLILGECLQSLGRPRDASEEYKSEIAVKSDYSDTAAKLLSQLQAEPRTK